MHSAPRGRSATVQCRSLLLDGFLVETAEGCTRKDEHDSARGAGESDAQVVDKRRTGGLAKVGQ